MAVLGEANIKGVPALGLPKSAILSASYLGPLFLPLRCDQPIQIACARGLQHGFESFDSIVDGMIAQFINDPIGHCSIHLHLPVLSEDPLLDIQASAGNLCCVRPNGDPLLQHDGPTRQPRRPVRFGRAGRRDLQSSVSVITAHGERMLAWPERPIVTPHHPGQLG